MEYELVALHKNKEHYNDCITILNAEWPRSKAAREHSLNKSCDDLPCCLVFRRMNTYEVIGYSQITAVQGKDKACLFESVIIRQDLRGTGLGRKLMAATEQFAKQLNFKTAYLNTIDKQGFYSHLGYTECGPVTSLGANAGRVSEEFLQKLLGNDAVNSADTMSLQLNKKLIASEELSLPPRPSLQQISTTEVATPPPPPPPPLLPQKLTTSKNSLSRHVIRLDPKAVTWMQKSL